MERVDFLFYSYRPEKFRDNVGVIPVITGKCVISDFDSVEMDSMNSH